MPLEEYLTQLTRELWGGEMELVVLSKLYTRTIVVYMYNEQINDISENKIGDPKQLDSANPVSTMC